MKYFIEKSFAQIVGKLWMPKCNAAHELSLSKETIADCLNESGEVDRDELESYINLHCGDFSVITDFRADIELPNGTNQIIEWSDQESEYIYSDCMYPSYEDD